MNVPATASAENPWIKRFERHRWTFAALSFAAGLGSLFLINRAAPLATWLGVLLLLSWLWTLGEGLFVRFVKHPGAVMQFLSRFATQAIHQETFCFTLPFFVATTTWTSGQIVFTGLLVAAALVSIIDPLYYGVVAKRRALYLLFHTLAIFIGMLTALPLIFHLTTGQTVALASAAVGLLAVPILIPAKGERAWRWLLVLPLAFALAAGTWLLRYWVPPATLWVTRAAVTQQINAAEREPGFTFKEIEAQRLSGGGIYAYTAIRAPRGLSEEIVHVWKQNGKVMERIPLHVSGGRKEGYRAWTHKHNFAGDPRGKWEVEVETSAGQLIGIMRFRVN